MLAGGGRSGEAVGREPTSGEVGAGQAGRGGGSGEDASLLTSGEGARLTLSFL